MMYRRQDPLMYYRVAINEEGKWVWISPPYTHKPTALTYLRIYSARLAEDLVLLIAAEDAASAEQLLEQLNNTASYRPNEQEQRRMNFIKWLIQQGKLSEDIPVDLQSHTHR
jgi:hypothetical protein